MNDLSSLISHFFTQSNHDFNYIGNGNLRTRVSDSENKVASMNISKNLAILILSLPYFVFRFKHEGNTSFRHFVLIIAYTKSKIGN